MIKKAAAGYVGWLCANGIVAPEKNKIYAYGMELVLSGLVNVLSVLLISILIFHPADGLLFLVAFIPLRTTAGGYHANSHLSCNIVFLSTFVALECLGHLLLKYGSVILYLAIAVISLVTLLILSPSEAKNKPLTPEQRRRNRRRSLILGGLNLAIGISLSGAFAGPMVHKLLLRSHRSINFDVGGSNKRKDVCAMKVMVERILLWFGGAMAVLARYTATASVSSTCFYTAYQPDVPDEL
ncbi:MAG: AgrD family cyclic lactone autoinducer peptide [Flavonifractor plautii]